MGRGQRGKLNMKSAPQVVLIPRLSALNLAAGITVLMFSLYLAVAQKPAAPDPHLSGKIQAPVGADEVSYCSKCHVAGCPMPHVEHAQVSWPVHSQVNLANGTVTCSTCHTPGFKRRSDAFLARDQKGLCSNCHYGTHQLPNAHPFGAPCQSCHTEAKQKLTAANPASASMTADINAECMRCHFDGPITHPIGVPNTKNHAPDLPLAKDGTITCVTCHVGHSQDNRFGQLLRKSNHRGALCLSCHNDL